jgi:cruciform cutting endonuclease 1
VVSNLPRIFNPDNLMAKKPRPVTAKALQTLLVRIGSASSGTKGVLHGRLKRDVVRPGLHAQHPDLNARKKGTRDGKLRIFSIDMGIKNLAYCDVEVHYSGGNLMKPQMDIIRWDKLNLVDATRDLRWNQPDTTPIEEGTAETDEQMDPYSLPVLSRTACRFVRDIILSAEPDIILIERQRWRSASSTAIQQWTVRVNTVEAMLWAILETISKEGQTHLSSRKGVMERRNYEVFAVDPKRVGQYWLEQHAKAVHGKSALALGLEDLVDEEDGKGTNKLPRSKAEKKAKIALLRSWLSAEPASTAQSTPVSAPMISFGFGPDAALAREALCSPKASKPKKKKKKTKGSDGEVKASEDGDVKEKDMTKLDDITDCCLQVAAWVAWESNRIQLEKVWVENRDSATGKSLDLDDNILKEMLAVAGEA